MLANDTTLVSRRRRCNALPRLWQPLRSAQGIEAYPKALLLLVLFWFVIIFASFGLFAPVNATSIVAIFLCSVGVGKRELNTTELQEPFGGLICVSNISLTHALEIISD